MPQIQISPALVTLTTNGSTTGYITVASNSAIFPNARGWLTDGTKSQYCIVTDLVGATQIGLRFISSTGGANNNYGKNDCSSYLTGSTFNQELQACEVEEPISLKDGATGGVVTQLVAGSNITLTPSSGVGVVTVASTGGGGGGGSVNGVTASANTGVSVDNTDPTNPIISGIASSGTVPGTMSAADKVKLNAISGTNTGDQTITLTGDVTGSGTGSFATSIASLALTKLATIATQTVLGNGSGSGASPVALLVSAANGLVATSTTLTNTVLTGIAGGQTWIGGTASGDAITLSSTSNATKGKINLGSTPTAFVDETQTPSAYTTPMLSVGTTVTSGAALGIGINKNAESYVHIANTSTGTAAKTGFLASTALSGGGALIAIEATSPNFTTSGVLASNSSYLYGQGPGTLVIEHFNGNDIIFSQTSSHTERMRLVAGSVTIGTGLATSATDGFLYVNSCAGVPTGIPTSRNSGATIAVDADRTNNKLNIYTNSNWFALNRNSKGSDIASATTVTPTQTFDFYNITGTTTIAYLTNTGIEDGNEVELYFASALTLTNNGGAAPGTAYALQLVGGVDASMAAGSKIRLRRMTSLTKWVEMSRSAA